MILILKHKWFDMIASGEKTEEYRETTHRFCQKLNREFFPKYLEDGKWFFDFRRGYSKTAMFVECLDYHYYELDENARVLWRLQLRPEWGFDKTKRLIVFTLGKIL